MAHLILVRHGNSEWNKLGLWTGHTDIDLTEEGYTEARAAGELLRDIPVHEAHVSPLRRTRQTLDALLEAAGYQNTPVHAHDALLERHYGVHTGKNKWQVKEEIGEEAFQKLRRGWNVPIPEGETLADVHARVVPYYQERIHPTVTSGNNVLIVSHGNTLRALVKHLEQLSEEEIVAVEIGTGEVLTYELDSEGVIVTKNTRVTQQ